ncbi:MAG: hypothetical protein ACYC2R_15520 [Burkholderiales bacterium]
MTTEFEFINVDVDMATLVFAENKLDKTPATQGCDPATIADAQFSYAPWQYLNPSQGARETFMLEGGLSVAARPVGAPADPDLKPNPLTPVFPGNQYLLVPSIDGIHVAWADTLDSDSVALISPPPEVNPLTIAIDWHWGGILIGVTEPIKPNDTAAFQLGRKLLFRPVTPEQEKALYAPSDLNGATPYIPRTNVLNVMARFQMRGDKDYFYTFSPLSALS